MWDFSCSLYFELCVITEEISAVLISLPTSFQECSLGAQRQRWGHCTSSSGLLLRSAFAVKVAIFCHLDWYGSASSPWLLAASPIAEMQCQNQRTGLQ